MMPTHSRRLLVVNMLYSFVVAAMTVMVPLYLLDRQVDIAVIGLILSALPLAFLVLRILFASMADELGTKGIAVLYSLANLIAIALYALSSSVLGFALGKLTEGARDSAFWAISRTDIVRNNGKKGAGHAFSYFSAMRWLADGLGRISIAFMIAFLAFQNSFFLLTLLSLVILCIVLSIKDGKLKVAVARSTITRIFKKHSPAFWHNAFSLMLFFVATDTLLSFVLPLYSYEVLSMTYEQIGFVVALFSIVTALSMLLALRSGMHHRTLLVLVLLIVPVIVLLPSIGSNIFPLVLLIAIGNGCGNVLAENIVSRAVTSAKDISTAVGAIYVPLRIGEFLFLSLGGFAISAFGYGILFYVCAFLLVLFFLLARSYKHHNFYPASKPTLHF